MPFSDPTFDPAPRYHRGAFPITLMVLALSGVALMAGTLPACTTTPQGGGFDLAAFVATAETAVQTGLALYGQLHQGAAITQTDADKYAAVLDKLESALNTAKPFLPTNIITMAQRIIADGRAVLLELSTKSIAKSAPDWTAKIQDLNALKAATDGLKS